MSDSLSLEIYNISRSLKTAKILNSIKKDIIKNGLNDINKQNLNYVCETYIAGTGLSLESAFTYLNKNQEEIINGINKQQRKTIRLSIEFIGNFFNKIKEDKEKNKFKSLEIDKKITELKTRIEKIPKDKNISIEVPNDIFYYTDYNKYVNDLKTIGDILSKTNTLFLNGLEESLKLNMNIDSLISVIKKDPNSLKYPGYPDLLSKELDKANNESLDYFNKINKALELKEFSKKTRNLEEKTIEDISYKNDYDILGFYEINSDVEKYIGKNKYVSSEFYIEFLINRIDFIEKSKYDPLGKKANIQIKNISYKELSFLLDLIHKANNDIINYNKKFEIDNKAYEINGDKLYNTEYELQEREDNPHEYEDDVYDICEIYTKITHYKYYLDKYVSRKILNDATELCNLLHDLTIEKHWR